MPKKAAEEPAEEPERPAEPEPIGLTYTGAGAFVAGWPASDHNELDEALAAQKLQSRLYTQASGPIVALPEPPPPEPEPEPRPPAPRPAFWWEEVSPESTAKARAVLDAAAQQAAAAQATAAPSEAPADEAAAADAAAEPDVSAEELAQAQAILERAAHHAPAAPTEPESGG